jgi:hypothetical protein
MNVRASRRVAPAIRRDARSFQIAVAAAMIAMAAEIWVGRHRSRPGCGRCASAARAPVWARAGGRRDIDVAHHGLQGNSAEKRGLVRH